MKKIVISALMMLFALAPAAFAADNAHEGHGAKSDIYIHNEVINGVKAEFQVMSMASHGMKDPDGATHHVMVKFADEKTGEAINNAIGKVKIIGPDKKEQVAELKDYSGIFAANFTAHESGKYGIICLFKIGDTKRVAKFWYEKE